MFSNWNTKKATVLALACLGISVYLFGVVAIAQTTEETEKVVLTPDTMAQVVGGICQKCTYSGGGWSTRCGQQPCEYGDGSGGSGSGYNIPCYWDAYLFKTDPICKSTSETTVCSYYYVDSWYYQTYDCYCEDLSTYCSTGSITGEYGSEQRCRDKVTVQC